MRSKCARPRPSRRAKSASAAAASTAARGRGPHVPALRYARRSRTGKAARIRRRRMSRPADRPVAGAAAGEQHGGAPVLLGRAGRGRVAGAADRLPRGLRELIRAIEPVAGVGGVVAAGLARADRGEHAAGSAAAGGGRRVRAQRAPKTGVVVSQAPVGPEPDIAGLLLVGAARKTIMDPQQAVVLVV